jgi:type II secretory pathway pseudopilin PulG
MDKINNKGISLIFVLAIMLMLMALGISALTAAGLSHRAVLKQEERNRFAILSNSMERVMLDVLQNEGEITESIFRLLYERRQTMHTDPENSDNWSLDPGDWELIIYANTDDMDTENLPEWLDRFRVVFENIIRINEWGVHFINMGTWGPDPEWSPDPLYPNAPHPEIRIEQTVALINVDVTVTQNMRFVNSEGEIVRETTTVSVYRTINGIMSEPVNGGHTESGPAPLNLMTIPIERNQWTVISRDL